MNPIQRQPFKKNIITNVCQNFRSKCLIFKSTQCEILPKKTFEVSSLVKSSTFLNDKAPQEEEEKENIFLINLDNSKLLKERYL